MDANAKQDLTNSVLGDLAWLRDVDLRLGDEALLRELSARLRRLLIDGTLQLYRKQVLGLRGEPSVNAPARLESAGAGAVFAQAGGATRDGLSVEGVTFWNRALSAEEIKARYEEGLRVRSQPRALRLSDWLSDPCLFVAGVNATRRDVIKFVANKLGGAHLDHKRNPSKFPEYSALDEARRTFQVADLDAVYHELSSIGQQLVGAPNVLELLRACGLEGLSR